MRKELLAAKGCKVSQTRDENSTDPVQANGQAPSQPFTNGESGPFFFRASQNARKGYILHQAISRTLTVSSWTTRLAYQLDSNFIFALLNHTTHLQLLLIVPPSLLPSGFRLFPHTISPALFRPLSWHITLDAKYFSTTSGQDEQHQQPKAAASQHDRLGKDSCSKRGRR